VEHWTKRAVEKKASLTGDEKRVQEKNILEAQKGKITTKISAVRSRSTDGSSCVLERTNQQVGKEE